MSDTPKTDAFRDEQKAARIDFGTRYFELLGFARELERENADLKKRLEASNGWDDYNAIKVLQAENAALREALLVARSYVYWTDEKHSPEDYPQVMETIRKDRALIDTALGKEAQPCGCTNGIIRCVGRDNEEIIEDCPRCSARKEAQP